MSARSCFSWDGCACIIFSTEKHGLVQSSQLRLGEGRGGKWRQREEKRWCFCSSDSSSELLSPPADQKNPWASFCRAALQEGAQCMDLSPKLQPEDLHGRMGEHAAVESHLWMAAPSARQWKWEKSLEKTREKLLPMISDSKLLTEDMWNGSKSLLSYCLLQPRCSACWSVQKKIVKELLCLIALSAFSDSLVFLI